MSSRRISKTRYQRLRPLLFRLDPERAHHLTIRALAGGLGPKAPAPDPALRRRLLGLDFPTPVGLAAGFDKNAEAVLGAFGLGFGFVEVGTVTPRPQPGNPRPRLFRLVPDEAVINRLGFNNEGHDAVADRLTALRARGPLPGPLGVNIGANKDSQDRIADYCAGVRRFAELADYLTANISSPNTEGLRDLQAEDSLRRLIAAVLEARAAAAAQPPILIKLAPDLTPAQMEQIAAVALEMGVDGLILTNTSVDRPGSLVSPHRGETGGLSGRPLFQPATEVLRRMAGLTEGRLVLVGAGGVTSANKVRAKLDAGAHLVQLYSALVFEGPGLIGRINRDLAR